jgi:hypothetical protein
MGSFIGHIAPGILKKIYVMFIIDYILGVFFILFALWWHINNCIRYLRSTTNVTDEETKQQVPVKFRGSTTYPCNCLCRKGHLIPIESILKVLITFIHFTIELVTGWNPGPPPYIGDENAHHTAMLFGFFLGSWVEIMVHYKVPLPKRTTQVVGFLAFAIEGLMMVFHLHARTMIDGHIHVLLALTIVCSMIEALAECYNPNSFWLIVARSFFALTQGTWFLQAAYVLWPRTTNPLFVWDPDSHRSVGLLTMSYSYHLAGNAFILIVMYLVVYMLMPSSAKLHNNEVEDEEIDLDYKLILSPNDDDNCV